MRKPIPYLSSWQQHLIALFTGAILMLLIAFQLPVQRSWSIYNEYSVGRKQIVQAAAAPIEVTRYQQQLKQQGPIANHTYDRELLLEKVTEFCREKELLVTGFPEAQQIEENGQAIVTNQIEVQGAYKSMVELLYLLEQDQKLGVISSVRFYTVKKRENQNELCLRGAIVLRNLVI